MMQVFSPVQLPKGRWAREEAEVILLPPTEDFVKTTLHF